MKVNNCCAGDLGFLCWWMTVIGS